MRTFRTAILTSQGFSTLAGMRELALLRATRSLWLAASVVSMD
jgi:hypothetical protein